MINMPVRPVRKKGRILGYMWGHHGKLYESYKYGADVAKQLAARQGRAIKANQK